MEFSMEDLLDSKEKRKRGFTEGDNFWSEAYLWKHAKDLKSEIIDLEGLLDTQVKWTVKNIFDVCIHIRKVESANLTYPIIFNKDGQLMDGYHRVCKAILKGDKTISCVRFVEDPPPEKIIKRRDT